MLYYLTCLFAKKQPKKTRSKLDFNLRFRNLAAFGHFHFSFSLTRDLDSVSVACHKVDRSLRSEHFWQNERNIFSPPLLFAEPQVSTFLLINCMTVYRYDHFIQPLWSVHARTKLFGENERVTRQLSSEIGQREFETQANQNFWEGNWTKEEKHSAQAAILVAK